MSANRYARKPIIWVQLALFGLSVDMYQRTRMVGRRLCKEEWNLVSSVSCTPRRAVNTGLLRMNQMGRQDALTEDRSGATESQRRVSGGEIAKSWVSGRPTTAGGNAVLIADIRPGHSSMPAIQSGPPTFPLNFGRASLTFQRYGRSFMCKRTVDPIIWGRRKCRP